MSIRHHPPDTMLAGFAAGTLDLGEHIAIATHLTTCPHCHGFVRDMQHVGGDMLVELPPAAMADGALAAVEARLDEQLRQPTAHRPQTDALPGLPDFLHQYEFGAWKWVGPSVHLRPIILPRDSETRVFLLRSGPGTRMLQHSHSEVELTCVLTGAFSHAGGHYGPGDFDFGDDSVDHQPIVDAGEECLCLVAMRGDLRLNGWIGRLVQPFVRL